MAEVRNNGVNPKQSHVPVKVDLPPNQSQQSITQGGKEMSNLDASVSTLKDRVTLTIVALPRIAKHALESLTAIASRTLGLSENPKKVIKPEAASTNVPSEKFLKKIQNSIESRRKGMDDLSQKFYKAGKAAIYNQNFKNMQKQLEQLEKSLQNYSSYSSLNEKQISATFKPLLDLFDQSLEAAKNDLKNT